MENYIVEKNDTIEAIGRKYNIPVIEIIKANNLKEPYNLVEGENLTIPTSFYNIFDYYTVKKGDNLYDIAKNNNVKLDILTQINGQNKDEYIYEGQTLLIPKPNIELYITNIGDTVQDVASYFKTNETDVIYSNNSIYLLPGQLVIYQKNKNI